MEGQRLKLILAFSILLQGCVSVQKTTDSEIRIGIIAERHKIEADSSNRSDAVFGGWLSKRGIGIGFKKEKLITINENCQVVFIIETKDEAETAIDLIKSSLDMNRGQICILDESSD